MTTDAKSEVKGPAAAYIPWKSLLTSTEVLEQGLPRRLDRSVFTTFSGSMKSWLISAYTFLGFIDSAGNVDETLRHWVQSPDERPAIMKDILLKKYPNVIALAAESGTPQQMQKAFEELNVTGTTAQRSIKFFIDAAEFAGIPIPPAWKKVRLSFKPNTKRVPRQVPPSVKQAKDDNEDGGHSDRGEGETVRLRSGGTVTMIIDANLMRLAPDDRDWLFNLIDQFQQYESDVTDDSEVLYDDENDA